MKELNLRWYALNHNFNTNEIEKFNIFDNISFNDNIEKALKNFVTYEDFKEQIRSALFYSFNSKAEYEIAVGGLFSRHPEEFEKIDVYEQVLPNLDILTHYIIDTYNNAPYRKKKLGE